LLPAVALRPLATPVRRFLVRAVASASLHLRRAGGGLAAWVMYHPHDLADATAVAGVHGAMSGSDERFGPRTAALAEDLSNGWHHVPLPEVLSRPKPEAGLPGPPRRRGVVPPSGCRQLGGRRRRPATRVAARRSGRSSGQCRCASASLVRRERHGWLGPRRVGRKNDGAGRTAAVPCRRSADSALASGNRASTQVHCRAGP
jgi:hypothetical protein